MKLSEATDSEKLRDLVRSLDEAREDLRVNGPVPASEVRAMLDALHTEWDELDGGASCGRSHSQPAE